MTIRGATDQGEEAPLLASNPVAPPSGARRCPPDREGRKDPAFLSRSERWAQFRAAKQSAEHCLADYLARREAWQRSRSAGAPTLEEVLRDTPTTELPQELQDLGTARDDLVVDLEYLSPLLDYMIEDNDKERKGSKWIASLTFIVCFATAIPEGKTFNLINRFLAGMTSASVLGVLTAWMLSRYLSNCRTVIRYLHQRAHGHALTRKDGDALRDRKLRY